MKKSLLPFALGAAYLAFGHPASGQAATGLSTSCAKEPPTPKGHIVAKVIASKTLSNGKVQITLDKGSASKVDEDDDVHLLACDGNAVQHVRADVFSTTPSVSYSIARFPTDKLVGAYVAIDIGAESRAPAAAGLPAGYNAATIFNIARIDNGRTEVHFSLGAIDGVMPGDKGYIATDSGGKLQVGGSTADLEVTAVGEKNAIATVNISYDSTNRSSRVVFIKKSKSSCTIAKTDMTSGNASSFLFLSAVTKKDSSGDPYITKYDDTGKWDYRIVATGGGTSNNILPGSRAYLANNNVAVPAEVRVISSKNNSIEVSAKMPIPQAFTHVRIAQSSCK